MRNQTNWARGILAWGLVMVILGIILGAVGLFVPVVAANFGIDNKIMPAAGLVLLVLGIVSLLQYAVVRGDPKTGRQMMAQERDERMQLIRGRAGQHAYEISNTLAILLLLWASFAGDVDMPPLAGDALWIALAVLVIVPAVFNIGWIIYGQSRN